MHWRLLAFFCLAYFVLGLAAQYMPRPVQYTARTVAKAVQARAVRIVEEMA